MPGVKFFIWYFLDWRGRLGRLAFFAGFIGVAIVSAVLERAAHSWPMMVFLIVCAGVLVNLGLEAKRWHDMGRSALWILWTSLGLTFWAGFTLIAMVPWSSLAHVGKGAAIALIVGSLGHWLLIGFLLPILIKIGWLAFAPGTAGFNDYDLPDRPELFGEPDEGRNRYNSASPPRAVTSQRSDARPTFGRRGL